MGTHQTTIGELVLTSIPRICFYGDLIFTLMSKYGSSNEPKHAQTF